MNLGFNSLERNFSNRDNDLIQKRKKGKEYCRMIFPQEQTYPISHHQHQSYKTFQMKQAEFFQKLN